MFVTSSWRANTNASSQNRWQCVEAISNRQSSSTAYGVLREPRQCSIRPWATSTKFMVRALVANFGRRPQRSSNPTIRVRWQSETGFGRWRRMQATKHTKRLVACIRGRNWYATKHTKRRESALDQEKELKSLRDLIRPLALAIPCQALTQAFATQQGSLHRSSVAAQLQHPNVRGFVGKIKPT